MRKITEYYESPVRFKEKPFLRGVGEEYLENEFFEKWFNYLITDYKVPEEKEIALFIVCSWGKPYNQSYIHYEIQKTLFKLGKANFNKIHQIVVSNCGLVPKEFENSYPFCAYDWDPNVEWQEIKEKYSEILYERLKKFLTKHKLNYKEFCCYLRADSDSYKSIKKIERTYDLEIPNLILENDISKEEKENLSLDGLYDDHDIILIGQKNLDSLYSNLKRLLQNK